jgi:hypothetical protein
VGGRKTGNERKGDTANMIMKLINIKIKHYTGSMIDISSALLYSAYLWRVPNVTLNSFHATYSRSSQTKKKEKVEMQIQ